MTGAGDPKKSTGLLGRLARDMGYYVPAQLLSTAINLTSIAIFTRLLDRTEYGTYALVLSATLVLGEFAFGWLQNSALRFWHGKTDGADEDTRRRFLTSLLVTLGVVSIVTGVVWPLLSFLLIPGASWSALLVGYALLLAQSGSRLVQTRTRAMRELRAFLVYSLFPPVTGLALGVVLIVWLRVGGLGLLAAIAAGHALTVCVELLRRFRAYVPDKLTFDRARTRELVGYGLPIMAAAVGGLALDFSDRFLIARFFDVATAGVYVVAYSLALRVEQLSMLFASGAFPLLIHDYETGTKEQVGVELSRLIRVFAMFFAPAAAGLALVAHPLVATLLGREFHDAAGYVVWLAPGIFAMGLHRYLTKPFQLAGNNRPFVVVLGVVAVLNVVANLVLLPAFGPIAAAWTTSAGLTLVAGITYVWSRRFLPYGIDWRAMGGVAIATGAMCAVVLWSTAGLRDPWVVLLARIGVGIVTYAAAALVFVPELRRFVMRSRVLKLEGR